MDRDVEQWAKALERGGFEREKASEPMRGVLGGPEYIGGYTCTPMEGSSEQISEGKAGWSGRTGALIALGSFARGVVHVHRSSRGMDKLPVDLCMKSSRGSRGRSDVDSSPFDPGREGS